MTSIDCGIGSGAMLQVNGADEFKELFSIMSDSIFYGESESPDCPDKKKQCKKVAKSGIISSITSKGGGIDMHPTMASGLPLAAQTKNGAWAGRALYKNI